MTDTDIYSAAEDYVAVLQSSGRVLIIGQLTGSGTGQPFYFPFIVAAERLSYQVGPHARTEFAGVGIIPVNGHLRTGIFGH